MLLGFFAKANTWRNKISISWYLSSEEPKINNSELKIVCNAIKYFFRGRNLLSTIIIKGQACDLLSWDFLTWDSMPCSRPFHSISPESRTSVYSRDTGLPWPFNCKFFSLFLCTSYVAAENRISRKIDSLLYCKVN